MKAAVFHGVHQPLTIEEIELGRPMAREIVVRTVASGVCHSDLHFIEGLWPFPPPAVLGHEAAGIVEEVGDQVTYLQARRPRDLLPLGVLRNVRAVPDGTREPLLQRRRRAGLGDPPPLVAGRQADQPVREPLELRGEDAGARERAGEDPEDVPLDAAALIGCGVHDRRRRGAAHGPDRAGLDGRRVRRRRRRPGRDPGRAHRGRAADHRGGRASRASWRRRRSSARRTWSTRRRATRSRRSAR